MTSLTFWIPVLRTKDSLQISWKSKETNTGLCIPNKAPAPKALRSLFIQAKRIYSNNDLYKEAGNKLTGLFEDNDYSKNLIDKVHNEVE